LQSRFSGTEKKKGDASWLCTWWLLRAKGTLLMLWIAQRLAPMNARRSI
jgi:hypothetical protein